MNFKEQDIVAYIGEYTNCHGYRYKIEKSYNGQYYNLVLDESKNAITLYKEISSVPAHEVVTMDEWYRISNVAIAKMMGWKIDNSFPDKDRVWRSPGGAIEMDTTLKFHKDWNWLMPVYVRCLVLMKDFPGIDSKDVVSRSALLNGYMNGVYDKDTMLKCMYTAVTVFAQELNHVKKEILKGANESN